MPITLFLALMFIGALVLMAVALSGFGSPDHSDEPPPNLPGHDVIRKSEQAKQAEQAEQTGQVKQTGQAKQADQAEQPGDQRPS